MFYNVYVNDWGETTYVPTTLGNVLLVAAMVIILVIAVLLARKQKAAEDKKLSVSSNAKRLAYCAMAIALGTVLSNIKLFNFPTGGSITLLSMLIICLPGYLFGLGTGLLTGVAYGILQMIIDPYILYPAQLIVDYLLAFGALGLSGIFTNSKHGLLKGYICGVLGRYVFAVLSGWLFFGSYAWEGFNAFTYSLAYNAIYIFAEAIVTIIILLLPPVRKAFLKIKQTLND